LMEAEVAGNRITARLGNDRDISLLWQNVIDALHDMSEHVFELRDRSLEQLPDPGREHKCWGNRHDEVTTRRNTFFAETQRWLNDQELGLPGKPRLIRTSWRQRGEAHTAPSDRDSRGPGPRQPGTVPRSP